MKYLLAVISLLLSCNGFSENFRLGVGAGQGDVSLSSALNESGNYAGDKLISAFIYAGYVFENGFLIDVQYNSLTDDILAGANDNLHLNSFDVLVGYRFISDKLYIEPKIGFSSWDLELEEGAFLNPGPEQKSEASGSDPLLSFSVGYNFSPSFGMSLQYKYLDIEDGNADSLSLVFDFQI